MADPAPPPGFPADSENEPPGSDLWVEEPAGPNTPGGPPDGPDAGVDPDKSNPASPNYNPHFDPRVSNPEIPVDGLPTYPDDFVVDHSADPNWVAPADSYPDADAPADPATQLRNATLTMYALTIFVNGQAKWGFDGDDLGLVRETLKAFLLNPPWARQDNPFVQVQVLDRIKGGWVDVSGGTPPAGWDGMATAEVRVMCGWGDKL